MAAKGSSTADGAQMKLLKMVNDQRARCKLTTLDNVMDHTGFSWVESMVEHARDLFNDHSSSALSEIDMNVNILRSPKKSKPAPKKKTTASKKASPYKKSKMPKESTPPRQSPKKSKPSVNSLRSSTSTKVAEREETSLLSGEVVKAPVFQEDSSKTVEIRDETVQQELSPAIKILETPTIDLEEQSPVRRAEAELKEATNVGENATEESAARLAVTKKRKSQDESNDHTAKRHNTRHSSADIIPNHPEADLAIARQAAKQVQEAIAEVAVTESKVPVAPEKKEPLTASPAKSENYVMLADTTEEEVEGSAGWREEEDEEEEVSRVMIKETETKVSEASPTKNDSIDSTAVAGSKHHGNAIMEISTPVTNARSSISESVASNVTKSTGNDDIFSDTEAEAAPSSSSAPKPSLRERIDRLRSLFSPAPRPVSSIPRLSPPKTLQQSPPRPRAMLSSLGSISGKSFSSKHSSPSRPASPTKTPVMSPPKAPPAKASVKAPPVVASASNPIPSVKVATATSSLKSNTHNKPVHTHTVKVSGPVHSAHVPVPPIRFASTSSSTVAVTTSVPVSTVAPSVPGATSTSMKSAVKGATPIITSKPVSQAKIIAASSSTVPAATSTAPAPSVVKQAPAQAGPKAPVANPFQKAQQQQQQQALATTSTLREKQAPPPSTAHIELEEPDSAYSDSDDEETVRRRQQHKPWETREGLAKALEDQAHIDADMIFGIPHGAVPIDEILPAETDYARAKRARPRSSSATWSRDGLKQIEIDRYNERMGIQGPGVLLPISVQDDGSGTPSRAHRLSAIAQSAILQGQFARKPSQLEPSRGSVSPTRPSSVIRNSTTVTSQPAGGSSAHVSTSTKYSHLQAGTPTRSKTAAANNAIPASSQKPKAGSKANTGVNHSQHSSKTAASKPPAKNHFQQGASQPTRSIHTGVKASTAK